jgi:putative cell wall-binding protein/uncharacterized protein YkwD
MQQGRRRLASIVTIGLIAGFAGGITAAEATPGFTLTRLAGDERFATAAAVATATFGSADVAVIASGRNYPDALAGNYLAGRLGAPVLLSEQGGVPASTLTALDQLDVQRVVLLGGEGALGAVVAAALGAGGYTVSRVAGPDRFATAAAVAREGGAPPSHTALLASGRSFPDALAAGPIAYGSGIPQLLTEPGTLSPATATALTDLGITNVVVLGGPGAVSDTVVGQLQGLGLQVARLAGADRYATSVAIADWAVGALGHSRTHVDVATGTNFPDALAGGAHAGTGRQTVLLAEPGAAAATGAAATSLRTNAGVVAGGHVFGGSGAVDDVALASLIAAGQGVPPPAGPAANACEVALFGLVNVARAGAGRLPFTDSPAARAIARTWSAHMATAQGLSHNPNVPNQLTAAGITWSAWAENVAFGPSAPAVHDLFMGSEIHRTNILSPAVDHIGIGCVADGAGQLWVTQVFFGGA